MKVFLVSLGCDKNLVDSEVMLGQVQDLGYEIVQDEMEADAIIVNTCAFIHDAKEESIETILDMAKYKEIGNCKSLIVAGCLSERYKQELAIELPEVDGIIGASNYDDLPSVLERTLAGTHTEVFKSIDHEPNTYIKRTISSTTAYGYLKVAEGCDNHCTYCIIPSLRGKYRSRDMASLIEEANYLVDNGKTELILVAQDVAKYGMDIYNERKLPELLRALCKIEGLKWVRLLYCYPEDITDKLIEVMQTEAKILNYIDMPLQHINDNILKQMARVSRKASIIEVINKLRDKMPDICIRTTFIVGFPGETEAQYAELKTFIMDYTLDRVGIFTYSMEEGTAAAKMPGQIDHKIMTARRDELMLIQQEIAFKKSDNMIGLELDIIIEGYLPDEEVYIGRCYKDAPSVDGFVFVTCPFELMLGQIVPVSITETNGYDLIGEISDESSK
ncbi:MAG: 30S ribosomal protein S12 methylthiotransferase RimO [Vallitaleaceae bacterium]|nr:30S ribosomal protein S12 methylthiotransferase RimO [Vallitaleaceae bacterium]